MLMQVVLAVGTLGIYAIYWYQVTLRELHTSPTARKPAQARCTVLSLVPIANLFAYWHYGSENAQFVKDKYPTLLLFLA